MRFIAVLVLLLGVLHIQLVSAAMRSAAEISIVADHTRTIRRYIERAEINDSIVSNQHVFLINTTNHSVAAFLPYIRFFLNHPLPRSYHTLSAADHPHEVRRLAANVLELSTLGGSFFTSEMEIFLRPSRYPFRKGDIVRHSQFTVEIKQLLNGKPLRISFSFNKSLDDAVDGVVPPEKRSQGVFETASSLLRVTFTPPIHSRWKSPLTSFSQID